MKFKAEDFHEGDISTVEAVEYANAKLPEIKKKWFKMLLNNAPEVFIRYSDKHGMQVCRYFEERGTHKARLVCIEKINGKKD